MILKGFSSLNDSVCLQWLGTGLAWGLPLTQAAHPGAVGPALQGYQLSPMGPKASEIKGKAKTKVSLL